MGEEVRGPSENSEPYVTDVSDVLFEKFKMNTG